MSTKAKAHGHTVKGQQRQGAGRLEQAVSAKQNSSKKARRTKAKHLDNLKHAKGSNAASEGKRRDQAHLASVHAKAGTTAVPKSGAATLSTNPFGLAKKKTFR